MSRKTINAYLVRAERYCKAKYGKATPTLVGDVAARAALVDGKMAEAACTIGMRVELAYEGRAAAA